MQPKNGCRGIFTEKSVSSGLEYGVVRYVIDMIEPDFFGQRRVEHRRVVGLVERAKAGSERADAGVAIDLQIENFDSERVAGLGAFQVKRPGERVIAFYHAERVAWLFDGVAEAVEGIGVEYVSGLQVGNRLGGGEEILYVGVGGSVVDGGLGERYSGQ